LKPAAAVENGVMSGAEAEAAYKQFCTKIDMMTLYHCIKEIKILGKFK